MASSSVFYRFKSRKDESRVNFDGTGISVFDLKREIIIANNLGKANDFDLEIFDSSLQEYKDDSAMIPRSSSVIVKRVPAIRPGRGKASITASVPESSRPGAPLTAATWHKGAMSMRFDGKDDKKASTSAPAAATNLDEEAAAMAAMFQAQSANWEETQEKMSHQQKIFTNPRGGAPHTRHQGLSDRPLPPSYVCYRCGQKGHWINMCPTNNDREYDNRPRIKRTTGIPRSMLKAVQSPQIGGPGEGIMVTPEGGYVVAQPDLASWQKQVAKPKGITVADVRERPPTDSSLVDPLDGKLLKDPVRTPCCNTVYSEENIQTHLLEHDFTCPNCGKNIQSLDKLVVDKPLRVRVHDYIENIIEESRTAEGIMPNPVDEEPSEEGQIQNDDPSVFNIPGLDKMQAMVANIPQLRLQIQQLEPMRNNMSLPKATRENTEMKYQNLQMELQNAQSVAVSLAMIEQQQAQIMQMQQMGAVVGVGGGLGGMAMGVQQRKPVMPTTIRNVKGQRPADFLEIGRSGGQGSY
ncbi:DWNN-domain-containing protein [Flagelloscypha sp. PMI_526]|nr:DWNN-domain-containing protein [Flagelloscypha sp. PMI_526]